MVRTYLVTGASSGIGETTTRTLVARGARVFAGVRKPDDAARLSRELGDRVTPLILDVTNATNIANAAHAIEAAGGMLDGLVNNAGIAVAGPLEYVPISDLRRQFEINVLGVVAVTQALLPAIRAATGRIVNVGSIQGRTTFPFLGPYSASKHALEAITTALRIELAPFSIAVALIEPGAVRTPIWDRAERAAAEQTDRLSERARIDYGGAMSRMRALAARASESAIPPETVASAIVHALEDAHPRARYTLGRDARMRLALNALPRSVRDRLLRSIIGTA